MLPKVQKRFLSSEIIQKWTYDNGVRSPKTRFGNVAKPCFFFYLTEIISSYFCKFYNSVQTMVQYIF